MENNLALPPLSVNIFFEEHCVVLSDSLICKYTQLAQRCLHKKNIKILWVKSVVYSIKTNKCCYVAEASRVHTVYAGGVTERWCWWCTVQL